LSTSELLPAPLSETAARHYVESLLEWNRQDMLAQLARSQARPIRSVALVGVGTMGAAIAAAHVRSGFRLVLSDSDHQALDSAPERIAAELRLLETPSENTRRPSPDENTFKPAPGILEATMDDRRLAECDLVLESIVDVLDARMTSSGRSGSRRA